MPILIVDDEVDVQPLFEQKFRKEIRCGDLQFAFAFSGEQALAYLETHVSEVVLILSCQAPYFQTDAKRKNFFCSLLPCLLVS